MRHKFSRQPGLALLVVGLAWPAAVAQGQALPAFATGDEIGFAMIVPLDQTGADKLAPAFKGALGPKFAVVEPELAAWEIYRQQQADLGIGHLVFLSRYLDDDGHLVSARVTMYGLRPGSDADAALKEIADKWTDSTYMSTRRVDNWVAAYSNEQPPLFQVKPGKHSALVEAAVKSLEGRLGLVCVPNEKLRKMAGPQIISLAAAMPTAVISMLDKSLAADWLSVSATTDGQPTITLTLQTPSETKALEWIEAYAGMVADVSRLADALTAKPGKKPPPAAPYPIDFKMLAELLQDAKPQQDGSQVSIVLDTKATGKLLDLGLVQPLQAQLPAQKPKAADR